jgi:hypothetical protein
MSTDVANEVLRRFYLQKLMKKKRKRQSQEVTSSTIATEEQPEPDNSATVASGEDEQNDSFETSDGLEIGDDFRVVNSPVAIQQVLRGQQPYILDQSPFRVEHFKKLEHYVMTEIANNLTPSMSALIPEHNRVTIAQLLQVAQNGNEQLLSEWGPVKRWMTWTWEKLFAAMKICFDVNRMGQSDRNAFVSLLDGLKFSFNPKDDNCLSMLIHQFTGPLQKAVDDFPHLLAEKQTFFIDRLRQKFKASNYYK